MRVACRREPRRWAGTNFFGAQGHFAGWGRGDRARRVLASVDLVPHREFSGFAAIPSRTSQGVPNNEKDESHASGGGQPPEDRGIAARRTRASFSARAHLFCSARSAALDRRRRRARGARRVRWISTSKVERGHALL